MSQKYVFFDLQKSGNSCSHAKRGIESLKSILKDELVWNDEVTRKCELAQYPPEKAFLLMSAVMSNARKRAMLAISDEPD